MLGMRATLGFAVLCAFFALAVAGLNDAGAETLKQKISKLQPLTLQYGVNNITINKWNVLIVRGLFHSETAWDGDGYSVLIDEDGRWQFARIDEGAAKEIIIWSVPHTEEDSITSINFFASGPANAANAMANLYLLKTHRAFKESPINSAPAEFTLYGLQRDEDFGIYYLRKLDASVSQKKYCNADAAAFHELGIPFPEGRADNSCPGEADQEILK